MYRQSTAVLESLLAHAQGEYLAVAAMLKGIPPQGSIYDKLIDQEGELAHQISQLTGQIAAARGVKG